MQAVDKTEIAAVIIALAMGFALLAVAAVLSFD
jgi:hypothetical protein